jgi:hypothetical protein
VTDAQTYIPVIGGTATISVLGEGLSAASSADWLTVTVNGNVVTLSAEANPSVQTRNALVTISAANGDKSYVSIAQQGVIACIEADSVYVFNYKAADTTFVNLSNVQLASSVPVDWMRLSDEGGVYKLSVDANTDDARKGVLSFTYGTLKQEVNVVQWGKKVAYDITKMKKATYKDGDGNVVTKDITITPNGANKWNISGLLSEGNIGIRSNTINDTTYYYIEPFFKIGTVTEGSTTYTLRCVLSAYEAKTGKRYIPTSATTYFPRPAEHEYRISFGQWQATNKAVVWMESETSKAIGTAKALPEGYTSDGFIVCRYRDNKLEASSLVDTKYSFLNIKLMEQ